MTRELIGLNRYLYTFNLNEYERYQKALEREKKKGKSPYCLSIINMVLKVKEQ